MKFADRLKFTASGTSAATINVSASVVGCRTVSQAIADGTLSLSDTNIPFVIDDGVGNWECSLFTITTSTTITRTAILASSNGGSAVTFTGATLTVFNSLPASILSRAKFDSDASFSTSVPLTQPGTAWMPQQTVSGAMTFTPAAGAVKGAYASVRLVSDGTNVPVFSGGFKEAIGSSGYDNRAAGIVNILEFAYDGYDYWYAVSQSANALPPSVTSAAVANATSSTVNVVTTGSLDTSYVPAASSFSVAGHTVLSVAVTSTNLNITVTPAFTNAEASRVVSYVQPGTNAVRDTYGNLMVSFSNVSITNNVTASATAVTLSLSAASTVVGSPVTVTVGTDAPLTGSQSESITLTAPMAGTWSTNPVTLNATTTSTTTTFTPSASGSGNIVAAASGTPTLANASVAYSATSAAAETLAINTISSPQTVGTQFTVSGTWTNVQPTALDYRLSDDAAGTWTQVSATINSGGTWTFNVTPTTSSAGRTLSVRDRTNTNITATSNSYVVNAAPASGYPQLTSLSASTSQTGSGPYTITGSGTGTGTGGVNDVSTEKGGLTTLSATGDFTFDFQVLVAAAEIGVGLRTVQSTNILTNLIGGFYATAGTGAVPGAYRHVGGGNLATVPQAGDVIRYSRSGTTTTLSIQRNGTGSFTVIDTNTGITTATVWVDFICCKTSSAQLLAWSGFA